MKMNLPVTQVEHELPAGECIVSKTDLKGRITYANDALVRVSGFSREELIGQPHNILRHPDMPPAAFDLMWRTLKEGRPWRGLVKNRVKNGDFYWVDATVVPIRKENQVIGYMSVRKRPTREQIAEAEALYRTLAEGKRELSLPNITSWFTIRGGFLAGSLFVIFLLIMGGALGIGGLSQSSDTLKDIQKGQLSALADLHRMERELLELRATSAELAARGWEVSQGHSRLRDARERVAEALTNLGQNRDMTDAEQAAVRQMQQTYAVLADKVIIPLEYRIENMLPMEPALLLGHATYDGLIQALHQLRDIQTQKAQGAINHTVEQNDLVRKLALIGLSLGILVVLAAGHIFQRGIVAPLNEAIKNFDRMAQGDLTGEVGLNGRGETGHLLRASAAMQLQLRVIMDELALVGKQIYVSVNAINRSLFDLTGVADEQHEGLFRAGQAQAQATNDAEHTRAQVARVQAHLEQLKGVQMDSLGIALLKDSLSDVLNAMQLQLLAATDAVAKVQAVGDLVIDSRQGTQDAYSASERLKAAADHLRMLVSYFETHAEGELAEAAVAKAVQEAV